MYPRNLELIKELEAYKEFLKIESERLKEVLSTGNARDALTLASDFNDNQLRITHVNNVIRDLGRVTW